MTSMTSNRNVPLREEHRVEVPGSPDQVWDAIATAGGLSSWFLVTDLEEREGGEVFFHWGDKRGAPATILSWDPPRRLVWEEPDWALTGKDPSSLTPLVSEWQVEAQSENTCVVRLVTSTFGTGADWEREFFDAIGRGWRPWLNLLPLYLAYFPGKRATAVSIGIDLRRDVDAVWSAIQDKLGAAEPDQQVTFPSLTGQVHSTGFAMGPYMYVRTEAPMPGLLVFFAFDTHDGGSAVGIECRLFSDDAPVFVEREQPAWKAWLESLKAP